MRPFLSDKDFKDRNTLTISPTENRSRRDSALDILRGACIAHMICSHLAGGTWADTLIQSPYYVSGADGFVFISGFVLGMIHPGRVARRGEWGALRMIFRRAGVLWLIHCALILLAVTVNEATGAVFFLPRVADSGGWPVLLWRVATLRFQPMYFDILSMFTLFLLFTPAFLALLRVAGRVGMAIGAAASLALYGIAQSHHEFLNIKDTLPGHGTGFVLPAWQLLFFGGLLLGHARALGQLNFPPRVRRWIVGVSAALFAAFFLYAQLDRPGRELLRLLHPDWATWLFYKWTARPGRRLYFAAAMIALHAFVTAALREGRLRALLRWLSALGRSSLFVYSAHCVFLIFLLWSRAGAWPRWGREAIPLVSLILLYWMARGLGALQARRRSAAPCAPAPADAPAAVAFPLLAPGGEAGNSAQPIARQ